MWSQSLMGSEWPCRTATTNPESQIAAMNEILGALQIESMVQSGAMLRAHTPLPKYANLPAKLLFAQNEYQIGSEKHRTR